MDPILFDPNNHAPEVMPGDMWDDDVAVCPASARPGAMLPPKKPRPAASAAAAADRHPLAGKLGGGAPLRSADDPDARLEVLEITGQVMRLDPADSAVAKVPRQICYQPGPAGNRVSSPAPDEHKEWGRTRPSSIRWIIGTALGVAAVVIVALMVLPLINDSDAARPRPGDGGLVLEPEEKIEGLAPINDLLMRQAEASSLFQVFLSAGTVAELLPSVRDEASVAPLIQARARPARVAKDWHPPEDTTWKVVANEGHPFGLLEGHLPDFSRFRAYAVIAENRLRLDWKATTGYGTATFDELAHQQGDPTEIRGQIRADGFFTAAYPEAEFQSYQLIAPDDSQALWCYIRRGEPLAMTLAELCAGGEIRNGGPAPIQVTVRLGHGPAGSLPTQWLITEMLHKEWINP